VLEPGWTCGVLRDFPFDERRPHEEALAAARRGWQVVPLHSVVDGCCTCRRPEGCGSPGKHPLNKNWPALGSTDAPRLEIMFGTDLGLQRDGATMRIPVAPPTMANVGILTGSVSGIVVLDVDPRNGGDESSTTWSTSTVGSLTPSRR
jgi:putative DNA primase/helicase